MLWRGFLVLMYCDLLTIGPWGHPVRHADVLNGWTLLQNVYKARLKMFFKVINLMPLCSTLNWWIGGFNFLISQTGYILFVTSFRYKIIGFCYQNCSDLLWAKNCSSDEINFWNSRLKAESLQKIWDHSINCQNNFW